MTTTPTTLATSNVVGDRGTITYTYHPFISTIHFAKSEGRPPNPERPPHNPCGASPQAGGENKASIQGISVNVGPLGMGCVGIARKVY